MSWPKTTTTVILNCHILLLYATAMNDFSIRLWCVKKSWFYTTTSDEELSGWTKKKLKSTCQSQTCTKKKSWSLFGGLLPVWSTTAFWILVKPLHLRSRLKHIFINQNTNHYNQHIFANEKEVCLFPKRKNPCFRIQQTFGKHFLHLAGCGSIFPAESCWSAWRSDGLVLWWEIRWIWRMRQNLIA